MAETARQLAAIMFTDIVGYTALMGKDSDKALNVLKVGKELQKPLVEKYHGKWLKEIGDGSMSQFKSAIDAVNCAIEIQEGGRAKLDVKLRIGIHLGDVTVEDVVYSYQQWYEGALLARAGLLGQYFGFDGDTGIGASTTIIDDHTIEVFTGNSWIPARVFEFLNSGGGVTTWTVSKKQSDELGISNASVDIASTGPWEIKDHQSGRF